MTEPPIAFQDDTPQQMAKKESAEPELISRQEMMKPVSYWKHEEITPLEEIASIATDLPQREGKEHSDVTELDKELGFFKIGSTSRPLFPNDIIRLFREHPLKAFAVPADEFRTTSEEAAYQWAKKKMTNTKQQ